jgi:hypothetical protein
MNLAQGIHMLSTRLFLLAACAGSLSLIACGGGGSDTITPEGTHHQYVVSKVSAVPQGGHTTAELGLDVGGPRSSVPDGRVDNKLGDVLLFLSSLNSALDVQATIDTAVTHGSVILLLDFQAKDFTNSNAGLTVKFGSTPNPPACNGQSDTTCGHHLMGGASFQVASGSPSDVSLAGKLEGGTFNGGPGELSLEIAIGTTDPIVLPLVHARAKATGLSATGMSALIDPSRCSSLPDAMIGRIHPVAAAPARQCRSCSSQTALRAPRPIACSPSMKSWAILSSPRN